MKSGASLANGLRLERLLAFPERPQQAFIHQGASIGELHRLAAWIYARCGEYGGPEQQLCLASGNKTLIAAALLASLAGGPRLLLPHALSAPALAALRQVVNYSVLLADAPDVLEAAPAAVRCLRPPERIPDSILCLPQRPREDAFVLLFTGGSTGAPQLWPKTAANLFGEAAFIASHYGFNAHDRIVATISPLHIYGLLYSVMAPLCCGAQVWAETPSFPAEISQALAQAASVLVSVPAHYRALRAAGQAASALRLAFSSAGMLDQADNEAFYTRHGVDVVEIYGSTETGGIARRNRFRGETAFTPFSSVEWKIIDERLALRSSYLSPNLPMNEEGFFISADRVRACEGGGFCLLGRVDSVTKVGGKRVDLEQVRSLIKAELPQVECLIFALPEQSGREHRIAVLLESEDADTEALRLRLAAVLEPYAMPKLIKTVARIPCKPNGKYDRAACLELLSA